MAVFRVKKNENFTTMCNIHLRDKSLSLKAKGMVDDKKISFNPAVELSYLKPKEQDMFVEAMENAQVAPSLSQAQRMKKLSQQGQLTMEAMEDMLSEDKKAPLDRVVFDHFIRQQQEDIFDDPAVMKYREGLTGMARINWLKARRGYSVIYA